MQFAPVPPRHQNRSPHAASDPPQHQPDRQGRALVLATALLVWWGMTPSAASAQMPHECVPYDPTPASGLLSGSWSGPNDSDFYAPGMTIPTDPGGGIATVVLSTSAGSLDPTRPIPALQLDNFPDPGSGVILGGSAAGSANELERHYVFEVAGGASYSFEAIAFFDPPTYPWIYSISWSFDSRVDCYEPNDVREDAKAIPLSRVIEAYGIAGLTNSFVSDDREYDWYEFTLTEPTEVLIETLQVASDQAINLRLLRASDGALWLSAFPSVGELIQLPSTVLPAGTWLLEVEADPIGVNAVDVHNSPGPLPDHFDQPYRLWALRVSDLIFRDGFESGDTTAWDAFTP